MDINVDCYIPFIASTFYLYLQLFTTKRLEDI
jgi:hypothetical protein